MENMQNKFQTSNNLKNYVLLERWLVLIRKARPKVTFIILHLLMIMWLVYDKQKNNWYANS